MALFLITRGIKPADVVNLEPGAMPFPESVIDMLSGGLGWPEGGWPEAVSLAVLGSERHERRARGTRLRSLPNGSRRAARPSDAAALSEPGRPQDPTMA